MLHIVLLLSVGLILLYFGAESLVRGSSRLALRLGVTPLVVGLTVVAFGTSAPELVVSVKASFAHQEGIALGNVIGSNIFTIAVILGLTALIQPIRIQRQLVRFDGPLMIGVTLLCILFFLNDRLARWEAGILFLGIIAYTTISVVLARRAHSSTAEATGVANASAQPKRLVLDLLFIVLGLGLLVYGAHLFVEGAIALARTWGVSEAIIGLTIVAAGTSLPELVTSVVAAIRKEDDIAVGNIIGSNIFNILGVLGAAGLVNPLTGGGVTPVDFAAMLGLAVLLLPMMIIGKNISRLEGGILLASYGGYLWWLWPS